MRNLSILVAAFCAITAAQAQVQSGSSAGATATTAPVTITTNESSSDRLKTTGSVFLPGNSVSSAQFNCAATGSAGIGGMGFSVGASAAKSLESCVLMHLMQFGIAAKDEALYEGALCTMEEGRRVYAEIGRQCPGERRANLPAGSARPIASGYSVDPR